MLMLRQEYVPARDLSGSRRAASAGRGGLNATYGSAGGARGRPSSALPENYGGGFASGGGAADWRTATGGGRRSSSAMPGARSPTAAWASPPSASGAGGSPQKRIHVQSLAASKGREQLAEDVVALREQLTRAKDEARLAKVEARKTEAELSRTRQGLMRSEELLNNKERVMSPTVGISQLYRSPDTTHLVQALKDQVGTC